MKFFEKIKTFNQSLRDNKKKSNRFFLLIFTSLALFNYLLYCFQAQKNPLSILPPMPVFDSREEVTIYVPEVDGLTLLEETRLMEKSDNPETLVKHLVHFVVKGSHYENTRISVPIDCFIRNVWLYNNECVIDIELEALKPDTPIIPGSEANFRKALEKTIKHNIDGITAVSIVERGLYKRNLWEITQNSENQK